MGYFLIDFMVKFLKVHLMRVLVLVLPLIILSFIFLVSYSSSLEFFAVERFISESPKISPKELAQLKQSIIDHFITVNSLNTLLHSQEGMRMAYEVFNGRMEAFETSMDTGTIDTFNLVTYRRFKQSEELVVYLTNKYTDTIFLLKSNIKELNSIIESSPDHTKVEEAKRHLELNSKLLDIFDRNMRAFNRMLVDRVMEPSKKIRK